jgi:Protein of unknown function (DUF669)
MVERSTVLEEAFDVDSEEGSPEISLLPGGKYPAEIEDAQVGPTKNGSGQAVNLKWRIVGGEYENRVVFQSILITHTSEAAQKIGRGMFKDVCFSCGLTGKITDLEVLKFKSCSVKVGIEKSKDAQYPDKNRVMRVDPYTSPVNGGQPRGTAAKKSAPGANENDLNDEIPWTA